MQLRPRQNEAKLPPIEGALDHFELVDAHLRLALGVARVEVRIAVVIEEHRDRDPEEAADRRHRQPSWRPARRTPRSVLVAVRFPNARGISGARKPIGLRTGSGWRTASMVSRWFDPREREVAIGRVRRG
jgi:hypothetical protein